MTPRIFSTIMGVSAFICFLSLSFMILKPVKEECVMIPGYVETCNGE